MIVKSETEAGEFEEEINKLRASGGMDCPEYTFEGIRGALAKLSISGSPMYVFTDAGPKDATELDIEEVKMMAQDYGVTINFLATGIAVKCDKTSLSVKLLLLHVVSFAAVIRVVTQRSSPLTAAHARATLLYFILTNKEAGFHILETWP